MLSVMSYSLHRLTQSRALYGRREGLRGMQLGTLRRRISLRQPQSAGQHTPRWLAPAHLGPKCSAMRLARC